MSSLGDWLRNLGQEAYLPLLVENKINFTSLRLLSEQDLKELGLPLGPRKILAAAIAELRTDTLADRRQLTVLFCDVVDSTQLSHRLDPEEMGAVMQEYRACLGRVIEEFGGYIADFAGDGVVAYFGWPTAHDDQTYQALCAGLAAVEAVPRVRLPAGEQKPLASRVGIATGLVVAGSLEAGPGNWRGTVSGETPNLASRLQGVAAPGQVVIDGATRALAGSAFELVSLGDCELKGFGRPVPAWRVVAEVRFDDRFEASSRRLAPLVGRSNEVDLLVGFWRDARLGSGRVILISGEAGVGKSRLARILIEEARNSDANCMTLQCSPRHSNSPFFPISRYIEQSISRHDCDASDTRRQRLDGLLKGYLPTESDARELIIGLLPPENDVDENAFGYSPQEKRAATMRALSTLLWNMCSSKPLLLVVEDAHWIDPSTRDFLHDLTHDILKRRVLIVVTHRSEGPAPLFSAANVATMTLGRLSRANIMEMVRSLVGQTAAENLVTRIASRTDGIPLFIEELTKSVLEASPGMGDGEVPITLHSSLMARLDRLGTAKEIAQLSSVIGRQFDEPLLRRISNLPEDVLASGIDDLLRAQLIFRESRFDVDEYVFKHALVRDIAYGSLLKRRRREIHLRIADAIVSQPERANSVGAEVLAHHFEEGGDSERASQNWERAAELALRRSAQAEAAELYSKALRQDEIATGGERALPLLIRLGQAQFGAFGGAAPVTQATFGKAIRLARDKGRFVDQCLALYGFWIGKMISCKLDDALDATNQMMMLAEQSGEDWIKVVAYRTRCAPYYLMGDLLYAKRDAEEALKLADRLAFEPVVDFAHDPVLTIEPTLAHINWALGYVETAVKQARRAVEVSFERFASPNTISYSLVWELLVLAQARDALALKSSSARLREHTYRTGGHFWSNMARWANGYADVLVGRASEGVEAIHASIADFLATGAVQQVPLFLLTAVEGHHACGDFEQAHRVLDRSFEVMEATGQRYFEPELFRWRGVLYDTFGQEEEAESAFQEATTKALQQCSRSWAIRALSTHLRFLMRRNREATFVAKALRFQYKAFNEGWATADLVKARHTLEDYSGYLRRS